MYKAHYSRFLAGLKGRLHFAAHSHHLWPDATRQAVLAYWDDSARLGDRKWEHVFGKVVPEAQAHVARTLELSRPRNLAFAPNTHELACRLLSCLDWSKRVRILTTDSEFHSFARQVTRLEELGTVSVRRLPTEPFATFTERFKRAASQGNFDFVYVSQVFYNSGLALGDLEGIVRAAPPRALVAIDGYHAFCAVPTSLKRLERRVFYLAGGYKYAQSGEGVCFMAVPPGCRLRPVHTGWLSDFAALSGKPSPRVAYGDGGLRFWGATFDPSGLYRFNAAMRWMKSLSLSVARIHDHVLALQDRFLSRLDSLGLKSLNRRSLITPILGRNRAHFLTFRFEGAPALARELHKAGVDVDVRGDCLRLGVGLYHSPEDVDELCKRLRPLAAGRPRLRRP